MTELTTDVPGLPAWPERRARRTAANAALADFRRAYRDWMDHGMRTGEVDWINWAERLASHLSTLIPCVDGNPAAEQKSPAGNLCGCCLCVCNRKTTTSQGICIDCQDGSHYRLAPGETSL